MPSLESVLELGSQPSLYPCRILKHPHSWGATQSEVLSNSMGHLTLGRGSLPTFHLDPIFMPVNGGWGEQSLPLFI